MLQGLGTLKNRRIGRCGRLAGKLAAMFVAGGLLVAMQGGAAEAATWKTISGTPGSVQLSNVQMKAAFPYSDLISPSRTAWRSNAYATYNQKITVNNYVYYWDNISPMWRYKGFTTSSATANVGVSSVTIPATDGYLSYAVDYTVITQVVWTTTSGTPIGTLQIDYSSTGDYQCLSPNCWVDLIAGRGAVRQM
jgi:hypothetical protein